MFYKQFSQHDLHTAEILNFTLDWGKGSTEKFVPQTYYFVQCIPLDIQNQQITQTMILLTMLTTQGVIQNVWKIYNQCGL